MAPVESTFSGQPRRGLPPPRRARLLPLLWPAGVILGILIFFGAIYAATLYPGVGGRINAGDSAKWQFLWAIGGTPHPPGYPLYLMLSRLFGFGLFFLDPALRITCMSLVFAILTLVLLFLFSREVIDSKIAQVLPVAIFGTGLTFWSLATEAEVYTLHTFFVATVGYLIVRYIKTKVDTWLLAGALIYSISFGNHLTMAILLPAIIYAVVMVDPRAVLRIKNVLLVLLFIAIGFSQYLYILYLAHSHYTYLEYIGHNPSLGKWLEYITGGRYIELLGSKSLTDSLAVFFSEAAVQLTSNLPIPCIVMATAALLYKLLSRGGKAHKATHGLLFLYLVLTLVFCLIYAVPDVEVFYLPAFLVLSLYAGCFVDFFKRPIFIVPICVLAFGAIVMNSVENYKNLRVTSNPLQERIHYVFDSLPADSIFFSSLNGEGRFTYHHHLVISYFQTMVFAEKNISHVLDIPQRDFYLLSTHLNAIKQRKRYSISLFKRATSLLDILERNKDKTIILSVKDNARGGLSEQSRAALSAQGLALGEVLFRGSYAAVLDKGVVIQEGLNNTGDVLLASNKFASLGIDRVHSAGFKQGNSSMIVVRGQDVSPNERGVNVAVIHEGKIKTYNVDTSIRETLHPDIYHVTPRKKRTLSKFLDAHKGDVVLMSAKDDARSGLSQSTIKQFAKAGIPIERLQPRGSFVAVLHNGEAKYVINNHQSAYLRYELNASTRILLRSGGWGNGNFSIMTVGGKELTKNARGINIAVIRNGKTIISTAVDTHAHDFFVY